MCVGMAIGSYCARSPGVSANLQLRSAAASRRPIRRHFLLGQLFLGRLARQRAQAPGETFPYLWCSKWFSRVAYRPCAQPQNRQTDWVRSDRIGSDPGRRWRRPGARMSPRLGLGCLCRFAARAQEALARAPYEIRVRSQDKNADVHELNCLNSGQLRHSIGGPNWSADAADAAVRLNKTKHNPKQERGTNYLAKCYKMAPIKHWAVRWGSPVPPAAARRRTPVGNVHFTLCSLIKRRR